MTYLWSTGAYLWEIQGSREVMLPNHVCSVGTLSNTTNPQLPLRAIFQKNEGYLILVGNTRGPEINYFTVVGKYRALAVEVLPLCGIRSVAFNIQLLPNEIIHSLSGSSPILGQSIISYHLLMSDHCISLPTLAWESGQLSNQNCNCIWRGDGVPPHGKSTCCRLNHGKRTRSDPMMLVGSNNSPKEALSQQPSNKGLHSTPL